jgi:hypothetical protein
MQLHFQPSPASSNGDASIAVCAAAPARARQRTVDHPDSTVAALRHETYMVCKVHELDSDVATWELMLVNAEPWP